MADGVFGVEVVTPERALLAGPATAVVLATREGNLTVLDGHTPLVGALAAGPVRVERPDGDPLHLAVHGGFVRVDTSPGAAAGLAEGDGPLPGMSTRVTLLAGVAELADEIDVPRAERAQAEATAALAEARGGRGAEDEGVSPAVVVAEGDLARAELRLAVAAGEPR